MHRPNPGPRSTAKRELIVETAVDAPDDVKAGGFWSVLVYWLERTEHLVQENWAPNRVTLIGTYGTDLALRTEINRYMVSEDPYGTLEFVEYGTARGDLRADLTSRWRRPCWTGWPAGSRTRS